MIGFEWVSEAEVGMELVDVAPPDAMTVEIAGVHRTTAPTLTIDELAPAEQREARRTR